MVSNEDDEEDSDTDLETVPALIVQQICEKYDEIVPFMIEA